LDSLNRANVIVLDTEKNKESSILSSHSSCVPPELRVCEQRLSCVIEGVEMDQLLVRFSRIDPSDIDREASFVIDFLNQMYKGE
jgi:kinetochore protein Spc25, fungi type